MASLMAIQRHIICVDGVGQPLDQAGAKKSINPSNILRLNHAVKSGQFEDSEGRKISQNVSYYQAITPGTKFSSTSPAEQQIQDIVRTLCKSIGDVSDEIYLFGSGHGAFTVRAVAGILHHMGLPLPGYLSQFDELYKNALAVIKARQDDDSRKGLNALEFLRPRTNGIPNIKLMGLFDAVKSPADRNMYDISIVSSVHGFRHAIAFNENRKSYSLDLPDTPNVKEMQGRSFIQAWFLGYHPDLVGGTEQDGLSVYPLQWIMVEAILLGLVFSFDIADKVLSIGMENPLAIAFPQFAGAAPSVDGTEKIQWQLKYANDISITMFDPHSTHVAKMDAHEASHSIHFEQVGRLSTAPRKIFDKSALIGYNKDQPYGTIIHPSVFCLIDRNQRFLEQNRFKPYKEDLADFEINCLRSDADALPPWLQDSQLLASGVKAFRILVCGKTGVGKSTLINKVFGVEMTEESNSYSQGVHDINKAFESPNHPGLLIHDSRGWQAGSDQELDLIAQFLRHRAFQKEAAEALHVIWFCVDSDVSRIEEADKRTFATIAQYSNHVPVFVVGTKKDKLVAYRKMQLLEEYMQKTDDYQESSRLANLEADKAAQDQFLALRDQLSQIKDYKADGYVCLSKNDDAGVKNLLTQTLDLIADDRVRLFCVAAQVIDVNQKIDSAITECMRLGTHAIRTAMVPLPFSGIIGTPTVSRIICEHVLQCFGFPKALPDEVEKIMSNIVLGNLKQFMTVTMTQFVIMSGASIGLAMGTLGIGTLLGLASCFLSTPPTARMLLKCSCDMILILERSFRYNGKYVSVKQIEDAAKQYTTIKTTTFGGNEKLLQQHIHDEVDRLIPLKKIAVGFQFNKLRTGFEQIVYKNRYDRPPDYEDLSPLESKAAELDSPAGVAELESSNTGAKELPADIDRRAELPGSSTVIELPDSSPGAHPSIPELAGSDTAIPIRPAVTSSTSSTSRPSEKDTTFSRSTTAPNSGTPLSELSASPTIRGKPEKSKSDGSSFFSKVGRSMKIKKTKSASSAAT